MTLPATAPAYTGVRCPHALIAPAVWRYVRFKRSYRDVEERLAARGSGVPYEPFRHWARNFGHTDAHHLRQRRAQPGHTGYGDAVFLTINGKQP